MSGGRWLVGELGGRRVVNFGRVLFLFGPWRIFGDSIPSSSQNYTHPSNNSIVAIISLLVPEALLLSPDNTFTSTSELIIGLTLR